MDSTDQIFLLLITIVPALGILFLFVFLDRFVEPKKHQTKQSECRRQKTQHKTYQGPQYHGSAEHAFIK